MQGRVLIIAGSDSGGGAGVQADIKTATALGAYAATAITAVTVQNTLGVRDVFPLAASLVRAQADAVLEDIGADVLKTGMLGGAAVVEVVADIVVRSGLPLVLDPVMVAKDGSPLLDPEALAVLKTRLLPHARLLTPNAPEAELLTGLPVRAPSDLEAAGRKLLELGCDAVLMKGGHLPGPRVIDLLITPVDMVRFESGRIESRNTHGTGCTLASACAAYLSLGRDLEISVGLARDYVREAILRAPGFGAGAGPLDHAWPVRFRG